MGAREQVNQSLGVQGGRESKQRLQGRLNEDSQLINVGVLISQVTRETISTLPYNTSHTLPTGLGNGVAPLAGKNKSKTTTTLQLYSLMKLYVQAKTCTRMFPVELFMITQREK